MFKQALDRRAEQGRPITVGFVGAGRMGTGAIAQIGLMRGIRNAVIADLSTERVMRAFELCRIKRVNGGSKPGRRGGVKTGHWIVT